MHYLMSHMTIRVKIVTVFALLLASMIGLGLFSFSRVALLRSETTAITDEVTSVQQLGRFLAGLERVPALAAMRNMTRNVGEYKAIADQVDSNLQDMKVSWNSYEATVGSGEEKQLATAVDDAMARFLTVKASLIKTEQAGDQNAVKSLFLGDYTSITNQLRDKVRNTVAYQDRKISDVSARSRATASSAQAWMLGAVGVAAAFCLFAGWAMIRSISNPITATTAAMRRLADRQMDTEVPGVGRRDEIGSMAGAVQVFKDNMITAARHAVEQEAEQSVKTQRTAVLETLIGSFESKAGQMVGMVAAAATEMEATAQTMSSTAAQTNQQASIVASAAEVASIGVQTVASAAEQLSSSISEISRQVTQSARVSEKAVTDVRRTDMVVRALAEGAQKIGDVVNLITNIASQTNLLALNATIEAARAGDAGKGFAVVASEVKNLAQQTAKATDEIGKQISQIQSATTEAVEAIRGISVVIEEIGMIATMIAAAVEEQGAATAEIARNVQQTAASTQTVTANITGVSQAASDTGMAAGQVLDAAGDLSRQAESLSGEVARFVADVRAA